MTFPFDYDMFAANRGFDWEKTMFTQEDWREYEIDYSVDSTFYHDAIASCHAADLSVHMTAPEDHEPTSEDFEPPTERMPERRSFPMPEDHEPLMGLDIGSEIFDSDCIIT